MSVLVEYSSSTLGSLPLAEESRWEKPVRESESLWSLFRLSEWLLDEWVLWWEVPSEDSKPDVTNFTLLPFFEDDFPEEDLFKEETGSFLTSEVGWTSELDLEVEATDWDTWETTNWSGEKESAEMPTRFKRNSSNILDNNPESGEAAVGKGSAAWAIASGWIVSKAAELGSYLVTNPVMGGSSEEMGAKTGAGVWVSSTGGSLHWFGISLLVAWSFHLERREVMMRNRLLTVSNSFA